MSLLTRLFHPSLSSVLPRTYICHTYLPFSSVFLFMLLTFRFSTLILLNATNPPFSWFRGTQKNAHTVSIKRYNATNPVSLVSWTITLYTLEHQKKHTYIRADPAAISTVVGCGVLPRTVKPPHSACHIHPLCVFMQILERLRLWWGAPSPF